ncbi:hypothetical protein GYMLUDRAFT_375616 [Collybiopsis luxurians FD-317 M1]|uniref:Uncharacterized protein n=1 Tax=Collybiopsis luxurians FD-317 M1 TaxID=944289 RepID=A0A0D0C2H1_9AGAR|nr:hypothetical protein GYMLUDRAFT_375616 [Collybiopsis luxurians FD-317 M1]
MMRKRRLTGSPSVQLPLTQKASKMFLDITTLIAFRPSIVARSCCARSDCVTLPTRYLVGLFFLLAALLTRYLSGLWLSFAVLLDILYSSLC